MRSVRSRLFAGVLTLFLAGLWAQQTVSAEKKAFPDIPRMTTEKARSMLGRPDVAILDVRPEDQWKVSNHKIAGAVHEDPFEVETWAQKYSDKKLIVLY